MIFELHRCRAASLVCWMVLSAVKSVKNDPRICFAGTYVHTDGFGSICNPCPLGTWSGNFNFNATTCQGHTIIFFVYEPSSMAMNICRTMSVCGSLCGRLVHNTSRSNAPLCMTSFISEQALVGGFKNIKPLTLARPGATSCMTCGQ
jgi:hypothetical protein